MDEKTTLNEKSTWMIMFHAHIYEVGLAATSPLRPRVQKTHDWSDFDGPKLRFSL
jgi:hypothetical protein